MDGGRRHPDRLLDGINANSKPAPGGYILELQYRSRRVVGANCHQVANAQRPDTIWSFPDLGNVFRLIFGRAASGLVH